MPASPLISRPRCLLVAAGLTVGMAVALLREIASLGRALAGRGGTAGPEGTLVGLCLAVLLVATLWAWLQALAGVWDAWHGLPATGSSLVRRWALAACGVALTGAALAVPAPVNAGPADSGQSNSGQAGSGQSGSGQAGSGQAGSGQAGSGQAGSSRADAGPADPLTGLPLPERAEGPARRRVARVVVRVGDSLWSLAARDLRPGATDREITERWRRVYADNRVVVGPDPDLVRPGQVLRISEEN